jgi:glycosyltransferase involved in cell wall biosynthesis
LTQTFLEYMNILFLTNHLNIGGVSSYVFSLAKGLKKRGHNVYLGSSRGDLLDSFIKEGITFIQIPINTKSEINLPKIFISLRRLLKKIRDNDIDIIHSNTRVTQVLGSLLENFSHRPHVSTCHGFFKNRISRRVLPCWGDKIIAISLAVKEHLMKDFGVREEKIKLIYNGIDVDRFATKNQGPPLNINLGQDHGPVIGIVARLSDIKGHVYLIRAMKHVLDKIPKALLLIVGEGRMKEELVNLSQSLGIEKNILFIPKVYDTRKVLSLMDIFVMPSLKEGLGLGLMEAMAWGLAVVASDIGGIKDLVKDGHTGLLVKPRDPIGISNALLDLINNKQKACALGNSARNFIRQNFSLEKMVQETEELYLCLEKKD